MRSTRASALEVRERARGRANAGIGRAETNGEWRRGRDSNPRCFRTPLFESGTINHSDTSPRERIPKRRPAAAGRRRRRQATGDGLEEGLGLVAADAADDLDPSRERVVLGELEDRAGRPVRVFGRAKTRASTSLSRSAPTHMEQGSRVAKIVASARLAAQLAGRLAEGDDDRVGRRVVRLLDAVMGARDHRLVDDGDGRDRAARRGQRQLRLGEGLAHEQLVVHGPMLADGSGPPSDGRRTRTAAATGGRMTAR